MKTGEIVSYSSEKAYGFIKDDGGQSYFFHVSSVKAQSREAIRIGGIVSFVDVPKPKGMAAENVTPISSAAEIFTDTGLRDMTVSKTEACGDKNRVVHKLDRVTVESRDPEQAIEILKRKARLAGCNALVNYRRGRRTGGDWTSNYKYTIHQISAEPALLKKVERTLDMSKAAESKRKLEEEIEHLSRQTITDDRFEDPSGLWQVLTFVIVMVFFFIMLMQR
ncbi:MAG: cold-shock protein [Wenzhouxiangella sp.]